MGKVDDLRARYDEVRNALDADFFADFVTEDQAIVCSGGIAREQFGVKANELDALCLMVEYERRMKVAVGGQIQSALNLGRSWNEIAAAIGMTRQGAMKRYS